MIFSYEEDGYRWIGSDSPFETPYEAELNFLKLTPRGWKLFDDVCAQLPTAEAYTKMHAAQYGWNEKLFELARPYTAAELPLPIRYFEPYWYCFENSLRHAEETGLQYVEGIVLTPTGAYVHAWNSHGDDVIDYTYPLQHRNSYFGVQFDVDVLKQCSSLSCGVLGYLHDEVKAGKPGFAHRLLYG